MLTSTLLLAIAIPPGVLQFLPFVLIIGVFYLLLIRPNQKKQQSWQQMLSNLKPGDKVTVVGHPQKTGEPGALFVSVTTASGETLTDRPPTATPAPAK